MRIDRYQYICFSMAFSFDDCVNSTNLLLLCEENSNACFGDLETNQHANKLQRKRQRTHETGESFGRESGSEPSFPLLRSDEIVRAMVEREREHLPRGDYLKRLRSGDLDLSVRREALDWIWKVWFWLLLLLFFFQTVLC